MVWGVVFFLGPCLGFGACSGPFGGVLDLGSQGSGKEGMHAGMPWGATHLFSTPRNLRWG